MLARKARQVRQVLGVPACVRLDFLLEIAVSHIHLEVGRSDGSANNNMFLNQLNPGVTMTGNLVFDVPSNLTKGVVLNISGGFTSTDSANVQLN
jgi:hypothetical protein